LRRDGHAARPLVVGQFPANELALDEELAVERRQRGNIEIRRRGAKVHLGEALAQHGLDLGALVRLARFVKGKEDKFLASGCGWR